jgi:hypothetical protein
MVRLNFTDTEAYGNSSLGRDALPNGKYHVAITDVDVRESGPAAKHPGSEYWAIEFTVQEGDYKGRKMGFYTLASGVGSGSPKKGAAVAASGGSLLP